MPDGETVADKGNDEPTETVLLPDGLSVMPVIASDVTVILHVAVLLFEAVTVITAVPVPTAVTRPLFVTVATLVLLDDHVTVLSVALFGEIVSYKFNTSPTIIVAFD